MTQIEKEGYKFSVDLEKTREYYKMHSLCDCVCCHNLYKQVEKTFPKLKEFLYEFGVDISKPDEVCSVETEGYIDYLSVDYTVCGNIVTPSEYEIDIQDNLFLSIVVNDGFVSPNEQKVPYFTFSVYNIKLPWVLEEPFPASIKIGKSNFFDKIFKKFGLKTKA